VTVIVAKVANGTWVMSLARLRWKTTGHRSMRSIYRKCAPMSS